MKKIFLLISFLMIFSCASKNEPNKLVIPPNFSEMPDLNNPEKISEEGKQASVERLKDLLLKSD